MRIVTLIIWIIFFISVSIQYMSGVPITLLQIFIVWITLIIYIVSDIVNKN